MGTVLVTGASGLVGGRLVPRLIGRHRVVALSRRPVEGADRAVRGDFASFEDLRQLDDEAITAVVHLAAEVGGTTEEAGLQTNIVGSRRLFRYLLDRGCRRFVVASSIATVGCLSPAFVPQALPMADRHPCLARDAYGLSKSLAEGVADYFARIVPDAEFVSLRFGVALELVRRSRGRVPMNTVEAPPALPFLYLGFVALEDMLGGLVAALESAPRPGSRVYNLVGPDVRAECNVADILRASLGARSAGLDLAPFEVPGAQCPPLYSTAALRQDLGFQPRVSVAQPE
jgi:nucleoside-diphosphate-sugar epimerase